MTDRLRFPPEHRRARLRRLLEDEAITLEFTMEEFLEQLRREIWEGLPGDKERRRLTLLNED